MSDKVELPYIRKTGRYLFYGLCSFGLSLLVYAVLRKIGAAKDIVSIGAQLTAFIAFVQLRDLDKYHQDPRP